MTAAESTVAGRPPETGAAQLTVAGLSAGYGLVRVVREVSFTVGAGGYFGIIGANGAGKSTLLKAISGILGGATGRVILDGTDLTGRPAWRRWRAGLALVPESRELFPALSVDDHLLAGCHNLPRRQRRARVSMAYELFPPLADLRRRPAGQLSGGQQQMVAIARAVVSKPKALLLDEPSLGLSPIAVSGLVQSLGHMRQLDDMAVVIAEQSLTLVREVCDTVMLLSLGDPVTTGPAAEVLTAALVRRTFL